LESILSKLRTMEEDGLVKVEEENIVVTTKGNSFIRNISAAIDAKLWKNELGMEANTFSKAI